MPLWLGSAIAKFQVQMLPVTAMGFLKNIASIYVSYLSDLHVHALKTK